jgi:predicted Holliday junction resolvase-like endonuclease
LAYEVVLGVLAGMIIGSFAVYLALRSHFAGQVVSQAQGMASQMFESQKGQLEVSIRQTYEARFGEWKATELAKIVTEERADSLDTSRAVLKGKIAEQIAPLLPNFLAKYNPADARFIGSPIDYLIFRNMSKGKDSDDLIEIVLLDVKTGDAGLNPIQKKIEAAAAGRRIAFDVLRINGPIASGINSTETGTQALKFSPLKGNDTLCSDTREQRQSTL